MKEPLTNELLDDDLLVQLASACLDKRRLRQRIPALASVRAWQLWTIVAIAFVLISAFNRLVLG